jgi:ribosomal protection tetracycline resistance protein
LARLLNLGILAHVDAGKTTLTERLLYAAGVISQPGSVDDGTTQTDYLALERQRGITIKSAVVSFEVNGTTVNLIDTPGHPDFIAEVERVLGVLDGAIMVVSAVEGVQPQTRVLMRALRRLDIPALIFVNKIDRLGADGDRVVRALPEKLGVTALVMGRATHPGTKEADFVPYAGTDPGFCAALEEQLAEHDDTVLSAYLGTRPRPSPERLEASLQAQVAGALLCPVFFGSAITGAGIDALREAITDLLPVASAKVDGPAAGAVFKVDRGPAGEKIAYVRMFSGRVRARDRVAIGGDRDQKITNIRVFEQGSTMQRSSLWAGQIGKIWGLNDVRVGDSLGKGARPGGGRHFAPPSLEAVILPSHPGQKTNLRAALALMAEQDPLINVRQDDLRQEIYLSLYGEVQKEVVQETLRSDFGIEVEFRHTTPICIERLTGTGAAAEFNGLAPNPFLATVGLRLEPAATGTGVRFQLAVEPGAMPLAFFRAVEDTVRLTLEQGLYGWQVPDCAVTMTHSGYSPRQSHAHQRFAKSMSSTGADFRGLTPLVVMAALRAAGTKVCEPVHRFRLELPMGTLASALPVLARLGASTGEAITRGSTAVVEGAIAAANVHQLLSELPGLTGGEGFLEAEFDHFRPVTGAMPVRERTDHNPLDRKEYLLHVLRRV